MQRNFESYLFLAFTLPESEYSRSQLAELARRINVLFPQPVLVLFRYGSCVSLAITYRRASKRSADRDVVGRKVTLIKDISCERPHPGHIGILQDFSLPTLSKARERDIRSFADLDDAWRESLSTQLLNRQFYREIASWYFWGREHAVFPKDAPVDTDGKPSLSLIRLLTRMIFCWFLREKTNPRTGEGLIPEELFNQPRIREILRDASPEANTYYTAILQNLFFATLNTEMDELGKKPNRRFLEERDGRSSDDHMVHQLWRHAEKLRDRAAFERLFRRIPFLNGGLFECLDDRVQKGNSPYTVELRIDGFSSDPKKQPKVPNFLFFGPDQTVDLSAAYGDAARDRETVRPLLEIFRGYKFTLTENTPIEEEVALDPELLSHVFENLLAAYNPETRTVARKETGSFYTPRVVVDWMVDEALVAYLTGRLAASLPASEQPQAENGESRIRRLLSWSDERHDFDERQVDILVDALQSLKALDPACGSGAFPMGLLQKLVHVLQKLDPDNRRWKQRQLDAAQAIESAPAREAALAAIERAFARDNDDYGRKLYLIENCLYGVDIQPIAVQIAKLRFFISLVVDQAIDPSLPNYGILPLPNLETKIVAADTLMGLKRGQLLLGSERVRQLERELQKVRHDYFTARRYSDKKALRAKDKKLCAQLSEALVSSGELSTADSSRVTEWNPYNTNYPAPFFDAGWMFGLPAPTEDGAFDILIGNPPYVRQEELKNRTVQDSDGRDRPLKDVLKDQYECYTGTADLYVYFVERSLQLLRTGGVLSFITSNKYFRAAYGARLRTYLVYATRPQAILDFGDADVFTSIAYPCILVTQKIRHVGKRSLPRPDDLRSEERFRQFVEGPDRTFRVLSWTPGPPVREFPIEFEENAFPLAQRNLRVEGWKFHSSSAPTVRSRMESGTTPLGRFTGELVINGVKSGGKDAFVLSTVQREALLKAEPQASTLMRQFLRVDFRTFSGSSHSRLSASFSSESSAARSIQRSMRVRRRA
jgi:adenine-specific DNA-methyltransferase